MYSTNALGFNGPKIDLIFFTLKIMLFPSFDFGVKYDPLHGRSRVIHPLAVFG